MTNLVVRRGDRSWQRFMCSFIVLLLLLLLFIAVAIPIGTSATRIEEGVLQRGIVTNGDYSYYYFIHNTSVAARPLVYRDATAISITIDLRAVSPGNPDLYVSTTNMYPNTTTSQWSSDSIGTDLIIIPLQDSGHINGTDTTIYFIGIYGSPTQFAPQVTFELVMTITYFRHVEGNLQVVGSSGRLFDGVPTVGMGFPDYYYYFIHDTNTTTTLQPPPPVGYTNLVESITFHVTHLAGDFAIYFSTTNAYPSATSFQWSSPRYTRNDLIVITPNDTNTTQARAFITLVFMAKVSGMCWSLSITLAIIIVSMMVHPPQVVVISFQCVVVPLVEFILVL
jgi:hypothetical protein